MWLWAGAAQQCHPCYQSASQIPATPCSRDAPGSLIAPAVPWEYLSHWPQLHVKATAWPAPGNLQTYHLHWKIQWVLLPCPMGTALTLGTCWW